jgi:hypothetical protein
MGAWQSVGIRDFFTAANRSIPGLTVSAHVLRNAVDITLACPLETELAVHNSAGDRVRTLGNGRTVTLVWDGTDNRGADLPAGMYYVAAQTAAGTAMEKIVKPE